MFFLVILFNLLLCQEAPLFSNSYTLYASTDIITGERTPNDNTVVYYVNHKSMSFKQYTPYGVVSPMSNGPQVGPYTYQEAPTDSPPTHFIWYLFMNSTCFTDTSLWHGGAFPFDHTLIFVKAQYEGFDVISDGTLVTKWSGCYIGSRSVTIKMNAYTGEWREIVHNSGYVDQVRMVEISDDDFKQEIDLPDFITTKCM